MTDIRFALAQIDTCVGDLDSNADKVMRYAHLAAQQGAQVVVFPEMTLTGYPIEDLALRATFRKAAWNKANWLATELASDSLGELYVVVGTVGTDRETSKPRNRLVVLHDGVVWAGYDKHFLPNYGVFDEFRIFSPGNKSMVLDVNGARIGVAICEDIWQDGGPVAELAKENIDLLLTMNGSPYEEGKTDTRLDLAVRRAAEVNAPMIYLNQVGGQDDLVFDGGSFVVDTDGTLLECSPMFMEDLSFFDLDTSAEHQKVGTIAAKPDPDEEVYTACVLGLKDYMAKNHFKGVCLGLSGGIDSALVAAMAADAVGGENVYGISMPSMYSSDGSKDDAADLARNIGAHYDIQPIEPLFVSFQNQLELEASPPRTCRRASAASSSWPTRTPKDCWPWPPATSPNWHAAIPRSTAMRSAAMRQSRTCSRPACGDLRWRNKAAAAGMGIGGLHVVGNEQGSAGTALPDGVMIPVNSIEKAPSAELRPGQKDSDSLPEYALLDQVLAMYIEHAHGRADLLADGFDEATVDTVMRLVDRAEWKRRQYPLGPKVTALAFGRDRRLPVTNAFRE